ncbi:TrkH family potassium uptake protein [Anaerotalea alkaliphila]|uniref:TrkH family potassium uptake protein n=1 Tax=Anaerotalea alkaliphila TaxID=2662126 RepID=A0A7X5HW91_9FIRM|nr:TrkH family potassium uptake protein [Anaerotalea alkaliphila]NDL67822.1 TrkH family potassium uptake protein [Anaerotalea alkaliphila]
MKNTFDSYRAVLRHVGHITMATGILMATPLLLVPFDPASGRWLLPFLGPSLGALGLGFALSRIPPGQARRLSVGQDAVIVSLVWTLAVLLSALPFYLGGLLDFTGSVFESVSGWSTTGLTVLDVEETPRIYLLFRSMLQFYGGVGLVLILVSALSETFGLNLYSAEGHPDRLLPNLLASSRLILTIYLGYMAAGTLLFRVLGMDTFDALNHSMTSLSTGGFTTRAASLGHFNSLPLELACILLMVLGATAFPAHLLLLTGRVRTFLQLGETRLFLFLLALSVPAMGFAALKDAYAGTGPWVRAALFQTVSALTTTGFSTVDLTRWHPFPIFVIILLMVVGGGAGSTAGGIKLFRVHLLLMSLLWTLKGRFSPPHGVVQHKVRRPEGPVPADAPLVEHAGAYALCYLLLLAGGTGVLLAYGYPLQEALFEYASALGTVGLSLGVTAPGAPAPVLWAETLGMLFGRLEIFVFFIAALRLTKDVRAWNKRE